MIKVEYLSLCDFANITQEGKLNVSGIFNQVNLKKEPTVLAKAVLVGRVFVSNKYNENNVTIEFDLLSDKKPSGKLPSLKIAVPEKFDKLIGGRYLGFVLDLVNLPIEKEGLYKISILINGKIQADTAFVARLKK